jgi:hypothetical protein
LVDLFDPTRVDEKQYCHEKNHNAKASYSIFLLLYSIQGHASGIRTVNVLKLGFYRNLRGVAPNPGQEIPSFFMACPHHQEIHVRTDGIGDDGHDGIGRSGGLLLFLF